MGHHQPSDTKLGITSKQQKNERLAKALRDNLHRRKAQTRARAINAKSNDLDVNKNSNQIKQGIVVEERGLKVYGKPRD